MMDNKYLYLVGISYLFIGSLDFLHTMTFKGMNLLPNNVFYANQFWVATRFLEAVTLCAGFYVFKTSRKLSAELIFLFYFIISLFITFTIIVWHIFPICYIEGIGQTSFKIYTEYFIIAILFAAGYFLYQYREKFSRSVYTFLFLSLICTILSEFCFTLYVSNYSAANEFGHYFKLAAFFLIYKANVETGFLKPTALIFKNLKDSEEKYRLAEQQLKELNATKDKLFSIIAHDLKNPFTSLISFSELIYRNADKLGTEKIKDMSFRMNNSAKQAYVLLDNLLGWSRIQTGILAPSFRTISGADLLAEAKQVADPWAQTKGIIIHIEALSTLPVFTDPQMINTVLRNLVSNAIKFSHPNSFILIAAEDSGDNVVFSVTDSGVGMNEEQQAPLFRIENTLSVPGTDDERGTGLGLILCREFVELCNGQITFKSIPGTGTTFSFTLPVQEHTLVSE